MKKIFTLILASAGIAGAFATDDIIILDLTKPATELKFNETNGAWTETYNTDEVLIASQVFNFVKWGFADYGMWWGFTPSVSADNSRKDDTITYQFSNMARGGIVLNEDNSVALDENGSVKTNADVPYLVGYYADYMSEHPCDMVFSDGEAWEPIGIYVNNNAYPYYTIEYGDAYAEPFHNNDKFALIIKGVAEDESVKSVEVPLASISNGDLTICRDWKYVDLTSLGAVNELWFELTTTDIGAYGVNTPTYFCLDKLSVKNRLSGVDSTSESTERITYDRAASQVICNPGRFIGIYDVKGNLQASSETGVLSTVGLGAGVYIVRSGNSKIKIVK